jgi:hypothetical protein
VIWTVIMKAIDVTFAALQTADKVYTKAKELTRGLPPKPGPSVPLTYKDVAHQQEQIRKATSFKVVK